MQKDIRVFIVEDDPYARDLMSLLLTRDWRTRVIGEASGERDLIKILDQPGTKIDVLVLDTEIPGEPELPFELARIVNKLPSPPKIIYTATRGDNRVLQQLMREGFCGYILKGDILYALATAVSRVYNGKCVITPGVRYLTALQDFPANTIVIDGRKLLSNFTPREAELIRLGMIFNLSIRDMADELVLSRGWVSELVSTIYGKLGVHDILVGESILDMPFENETVLKRLQDIGDRPVKNLADGRMRKAPWMATLAFHLLTIPEIEDL